MLLFPSYHHHLPIIIHSLSHLSSVFKECAFLSSGKDHMDSDGDGVVLIRRAEIDTRSPFRSVKEAVSLFGERVLAGEVYASKLKKLQRSRDNSDGSSSNYGSEDMAAELEETRHRLDKGRSEGAKLANSLTILQLELESAKQELQLMKCKDKEVINVVEKHRTFEFRDDHKVADNEMQRKRYVTFANPPAAIAQVVQRCPEVVLERHPSLRQAKKKKPLIGGLFSWKKNGGSRPG